MAGLSADGFLMMALQAERSILSGFAGRSSQSTIRHASPGTK
jgi:hypothetical protein